MHAELVQKKEKKKTLLKTKAKHMTTMGEFHSSLLPPAIILLSAPEEKWGDTPHPSPWKEWVFQTHSFASQWQILGRGLVWGWWRLRWNNRDTFLRWRAAPSLTWQDISPETTFIWAQSSLCVALLTRTQISLTYELLFPRDTLRPTSVLCAGQIAAHNVTCWR